MLLCALFFGIFCFCVCEFFYFLIRSDAADNATLVYNHRSTPPLQQPTYQQPTHLQQNFALFSIATDYMSFSNVQQNAISAVPVLQILTLKTTKEIEFGSLHKDLNSFETSAPVENVRQI
jgi:hypothetical protein